MTKSQKEALQNSIIKNLHLYHCELGSSQTDMVVEAVKRAISKSIS